MTDGDGCTCTWTVTYDRMERLVEERVPDPACAKHKGS
jgi:hypothetical protein